jgi:hypothetical protein
MESMACSFIHDIRATTQATCPFGTEMGHGNEELVRKPDDCN